MSATRRISCQTIPTARTTISLSEVKQGFVFSPHYDRQGKSDANTFRVRANRFVRALGLNQNYEFDNDGNNDGNNADRSNLGVRRTEILDALSEVTGKLNVVAYFGHGAGSGLLSAGFRPADVDLLAEAIAEKADRRIVVILYACSSGRPGGFGQRLYHALRRNGKSATVFGHEDPGHATSNPRVRRYPGGNWAVSPQNPLFRTWSRALRQTDLWIRFPFLEPHQLNEELLRLQSAR